MSRRRHCGCTNHKGHPKICHATYDAALRIALARSRSGGRWEVYACPVRTETWHVTQRRT